MLFSINFDRPPFRISQVYHEDTVSEQVSPCDFEKIDDGVATDWQ